MKLLRCIDINLMSKKIKETFRNKIETLIGLCFVSKRKLIKYIHYVEKFPKYHEVSKENYPEKYKDWYQDDEDNEEEDEEEEE